MTESKPDPADYRQLLITTIDDVLTAGVEADQVSVATIETLGEVAVLSGSSDSRSLDRQLPVSVTLADRTTPDSAGVVTIMTRGGFIGRKDVGLDPTPDDLQKLGENPLSALHDYQYIQILKAATFSLEASRNAAAAFTRSPGLIRILAAE